MSVPIVSSSKREKSLRIFKTRKISFVFKFYFSKGFFKGGGAEITRQRMAVPPLPPKWSTSAKF